MTSPSTAQVGLGQPSLPPVHLRTLSSSPGSVKSLVQKHEDYVEKARSPSNSPTSTKRSSSSSFPSQQPPSPSPNSSLPLPSTTSSLERSHSAATSDSAGSVGGGGGGGGGASVGEQEGSVHSMTGSGTLPDINEVEVVEADGEEIPSKSDPADGEPASTAAPPPTTTSTSHTEATPSDLPPLPSPAPTTSSVPSLPFPKPSADSPLARIVELLPSLSAKEQAVVQTNLERLGGYPRELPLSATWTLYFSDTSASAGHGSVSTAKYTESRTKLFTVSSVGSLCGSLKAYKKLIGTRPSSKRGGGKGGGAGEDGGMGMGLGTFRAGQNLHFFKSVPFIEPTWEDPYNCKGGRLTISPPLSQIDKIYERLVLLLAGHSLESATADLLSNPQHEGMVCGVVANRRTRGDRIELWVGGKKEATAPNSEWVEKLKEVLSEELEMPELRTNKYKKHL